MCRNCQPIRLKSISIFTSKHVLLVFFCGFFYKLQILAEDVHNQIRRKKFMYRVMLKMLTKKLFWSNVNRILILMTWTWILYFNSSTESIANNVESNNNRNLLILKCTNSAYIDGKHSKIYRFFATLKIVYTGVF